MNPPFSLLRKVLTKIESEQVEGFLLCPNWTTTLLWEKVHAMRAKAHFFPQGHDCLKLKMVPADQSNEECG